MSKKEKSIILLTFMLVSGTLAGLSIVLSLVDIYFRYPASQRGTTSAICTVTLAIITAHVGAFWCYWRIKHLP